VQQLPARGPLGMPNLVNTAAHRRGLARAGVAGYLTRWIPRLRQIPAGAIIGAERRYVVRNFSAVIERDPDTGLFVGFVPGFPGAHSQGTTLDELNANLREVISMLLEDGEPVLESEFVGVQNVAIA
jgi:predicted RNase H-like HicB family nuclease